MKLFTVRRTECISWCEDDEMAIIAEDELHAERKARIYSDDFKKARNLDVEEIDMDEEQVVLVSNTGA